MTVMFVDLVGSTEMAVAYEPEIVRDVTRRYQEIAVRVVRAHDGFVAQYAGDGILVYFGYPAAQEDDAAASHGCGPRPPRRHPGAREGS